MNEEIDISHRKFFDHLSLFVLNFQPFRYYLRGVRILGTGYTFDHILASLKFRDALGVDQEVQRTGNESTRS